MGISRTQHKMLAPIDLFYAYLSEFPIYTFCPIRNALWKVTLYLSFPKSIFGLIEVSLDDFVVVTF
jgi:hypothetical protein